MLTAARERAGGLALGFTVVRTEKKQQAPQPLPNVEDLGWKPDALPRRSLPGLYDEVQ